MKGTRFTRGFHGLTKTIQQAETRALSTVKLSRWPDLDELRVTFMVAGRIQSRMMHVQDAAEREFILYSTELGVF